MENLNISVVIPAYNAAPYIEKAVLSALQFSEVKEVIIVEDCSTDNTLQECIKLEKQHPRVHLYRHEDRKNHGVSATRNLGIDRATQEFITFLDADDYWLPNRFDAERVIFKDPKVDGVFGAIDAEFIGEDGKENYTKKFGDNTLCTVQFPSEGKEIFFNLIQEPNRFGSFFSMIALTIKKKSLEKNNLRLNENLSFMEDKEFIIRLAYHTYLKSGIIDRGIAIRTAHDSNSIMSLQNNSRNFFYHNSKLYKSLLVWGQKQNNFPSESLKYFKLKYLSSAIAAKTGIKKYLSFIMLVLFNPELLKTRYRYFALKNNL